MQERNIVWQERFGLYGCPFHWDINTATISFRRDTDEVIASVGIVGTTSVCESTFLWGWANESIPHIARRHLELVQEFGAKHQLHLLTKPEFPARHPEAIEMVAIAGRVLDAEGIFVHSVDGDLTCFFALSDFQIRTLNAACGS